MLQAASTSYFSKFSLRITFILAEKAVNYILSTISTIIALNLFENAVSFILKLFHLNKFVNAAVVIVIKFDRKCGQFITSIDFMKYGQFPRNRTKFSIRGPLFNFICCQLQDLFSIHLHLHLLKFKSIIGTSVKTTKHTFNFR